VVSASRDRTLKVWDLDSGGLLATLEGHVDWVNACALTPDGRRVVSASADQTLKVWDLDSYACVLTHRGDAFYTAVAATATSVVAGDVAGTVWFLDWPASMAPPIR
jgi:WD40 repeat protein